MIQGMAICDNNSKPVTIRKDLKATYAISNRLLQHKKQSPTF